MNKRIAPLSLSVLFLLGLASCAGASNESKISLYRESSRLIYASALGEGSAPLATYRHKDLGDAPYVELGQFLQALDTNHVLLGASVEKLADHLYAVSQRNVITLLIDANKDVITAKNLDYLISSGDIFNHGVGGDTCAPNDDPDNCVHTSYETQVIGDPKDSYYDFGSYGFDIVEGEEGKLYLPYQPFGSFLFARQTYDVVYNGVDFFCTAMINKDYSVTLPGPYCSYYANTDEFLFGGMHFSSVSPLEGEKYRFCAPVPGGVALICLLHDGGVSFRSASSATEAGKEETWPTQLSYTEDGNGIYIASKAPSASSSMKSVFKIPKEKTYFNAKVRSPSIAKHSYDVLRFQYENLYGLRKELYARYNVSSIEELIEKKGLKDRLLSTDSLAYDDALCEFLMGNIDDGHTKYPGRCLFSGDPTDGTTELVSAKTGSRRGGLFEKKTLYQNKRTEVMAAIDPAYSDPTKQVGCFMEGETAVIRFDGFNLSSEISNFLEGRAPVSEDIATAFATDTCDGAYLSMKEIEKHSEIKNVVIDLTINGGGIAATLPYLAAMWTDDPTFRVRDVKQDVIKEFHYQVDFNRNGVFNEEGDTYKGKYEFFILISEFSFSCGNGLPTMAYSDGVTLIGSPHGGGGACPVATMSDGSGTIFNTSMPTQIVYQDGQGQYINNDEGAPVSPEHQLPLESWYDLSALDAFVKSIKA